MNDRNVPSAGERLPAIGTPVRRRRLGGRVSDSSFSCSYQIHPLLQTSIAYGVLALLCFEIPSAAPEAVASIPAVAAARTSPVRRTEVLPDRPSVFVE
jgi:hypothetical protein